MAKAKVLNLDERRACPHCSNLDALFERVRRIELLLAFMAGGTVLGGGSVALKVFGVF